MKKLFKRIKWTWLLFVVGFIFIILFYNKYFSKSSCTNPFEVRDYTLSRKETIKVCDGIIFYGSTKITDRKSYQDLFEYKMNDKYELTQQRIRIFYEKNDITISIVSIVNGVTWYKSAIGIYKENNNNFKLIFKKGFSENQGRYSDINFSSGDESGHSIDGLLISGDVGHLGCYGCMMEWTDYYNWDSNKQTFVLANNKHTIEFNKLLEKYQNEDETACNDSDYSKASITELYTYRKGIEKFCDGKAIVPYISSDQATMFLKAKEAIKRVIKGENISINQIKDISF